LTLVGITDYLGGFRLSSTDKYSSTGLYEFVCKLSEDGHKYLHLGTTRGCNGEMAQIFLSFDSYENRGMDRVSLD
jgi:hypothetical protein